MYIILADIHAKPQHAGEYIQALLLHAKNTRAEPGCVRFDVLQVTDDSNRFRLYEVYRDEQAFEAHRENPSIAATLGKVADWKAEPTVQTVCTNISPEDNAWEKLEF